MHTIRLGTFTPSVLLDVAREVGALAAADLSVLELSVPSSPAQCTSLLAGELDAVFTSPDNVLAYRFVADNPLVRQVDMTVVAALDRGLGLCLMTAPTVTDLSGGIDLQLGVDVPKSGFALVAYALLERHGRAPGSYEIRSLGSTPKRAEALIAGQVSTTVLNAGNELRAARNGCRVQSRASDLGPYLGMVLARLDDTTAETRETVDRLAAVLTRTAAAIVEGSYGAETLDACARRLGLRGDDAVAHRDRLRSADEGLVPDGIVDLAAVETLVRLRREHLPGAGLEDVVDGIGTWVAERALAQ